MVFAKNPRPPHELLRDEAKDKVGLQRLGEDPPLRDAVSRELAQH